MKYGTGLEVVQEKPMQYIPHLVFKGQWIAYIMALTFVSPQGFRFFSIMTCIAILVLAFVKSVLDIMPPNEFLHFALVNFSGIIIFIISVYAGKRIRNSKYMWYINSFSVAGIALILYGSTVEIQGKLNEKLMPVFYIIEIFIISYIGNKISQEDSRESYTQMCSQNNL